MVAPKLASLVSSPCYSIVWFREDFLELFDHYFAGPVPFGAPWLLLKAS